MAQASPSSESDGGESQPFRMTVNVKVTGDPSAFDATQRHAFLSAFARVVRVGYQIGDLRWDPGHFDHTRGRAQITALHHGNPSSRMEQGQLTVDVTIDTYKQVADEILALVRSTKFSTMLSEQFNRKEFAHETRFSEPDLIPGKKKRGGKGASAMRKVVMNMQLVGVTPSSFSDSKKVQLLTAYAQVCRLGFYFHKKLHDPDGVAQERGTVRISWASGGKTAVSTVVVGLEMRLVSTATAKELVKFTKSFDFRRKLADQISENPNGDEFGITTGDIAVDDVNEVMPDGEKLELFAGAKVKKALQDVFSISQEAAAMGVIVSIFVLALCMRHSNGVRGHVVDSTNINEARQYARVAVDDDSEDEEFEGVPVDHAKPAPRNSPRVAPEPRTSYGASSSTAPGGYTGTMRRRSGDGPLSAV